MTIPLCKTGLDRHSVFGYTCNRCLASQSKVGYKVETKSEPVKK